MNKRTLFTLLVGFSGALFAGTLGSSPAHALGGFSGGGLGDDSPVNLPIDIELGGFGAWSSATGYTGSNAPTLIQFGGSGTVAARVGGNGWLLLGVATEFESINQTSDVMPAVGNFTGTRFSPVAPMLGLRFSSFILKGEYQLLGDYNLSSGTATGGTVTYSGVSGFKAAILYNLFSMIWVGPHYEQLSFTKQTISNVGTTTLASPLTIWQVGLSAALVF